jgi:hypothetical protein
MKIQSATLFVSFLSLLFNTAAHAADAAEGATPVTPYKQCWQDAEKQKLRSEEIQSIVAMDQADRVASPIDWNVVSPRDEIRIRRVGEIFAEGCFHTAADYAAAALVFQHGSVPDHYYQAYLWAKRAFDLGDLSQKQMIANAIDRYLINLGFKQIFGAQTFRDTPNGCRCLGPVETKFSEKSRVRVSGISLRTRISDVRAGNKDRPECQAVLYCDKDLRRPPKGLFPGIW